MGPEIYSLVGVYSVVSSIVLAFSHLGVETTMMREALFWKEQGEVNCIKEYTMQSLLSRFMGFVFLSPFIVGYLLFLCFYKYNGSYLLLLLSFYFGSCASALNDSMSLIIRSQGDYVFSQFARTLNSTITKFLAIFLYIKFGAMPYLYFYALVPFPLMLIFIVRLNNNIDFEYLKINGTLIKIKESKNLWLKSYLDYFSVSADNLLVSILFPPTIMGVYSLYKNLEQIAKSFIEGFFDVLTQKFVQFKGNMRKLVELERRVNFVRWFVIGIILIGVVAFSINSTFFIELANLRKYQNVDMVLYCVMIVSIIYLVGKNEINIVSLFATSRTIFNLGVFVFIMTLLSFLVVVAVPTLLGVLLQRIIIYTITSASAMMLFYRNRESLYTNIYK